MLLLDFHTDFVQGNQLRFKIRKKAYETKNCATAFVWNTCE